MEMNRDRKEPKPRKNELNQNPGFANHWTEPENKKMWRTQTEPYSVKNRTGPKPKCHGSYTDLSPNETVGTFTYFTVNEAFYFTETNQVQVPA